ATDTRSFQITGTSATFLVSDSVGHGSAAKLDAPIPTQLLAGATFPLVVTAYDDAGQPVTDYTGTIHFSSSDPKAVLPADYTFKSSDHGSKTFNSVALTTAGTWSLTVTDVANLSLRAGQSSITVFPYNPASF